MALNSVSRRRLSTRLRPPADGQATFVGGTALALLGVSSQGVAQRAGAMPRIGYLTPGNVVPQEPAFWQGMRELGYIEGKTISVDRRSAEGDLSRLPALAAELVRGRPDLIVAIATAASIAVTEATPNIPVVMVAVSDPVLAGLVGNLMRPGGNVTGTASQSPAVVGKQVEMIRQVLPRATRVAMLWNPGNAVYQQLVLGEALIAAARLRMPARILEVRDRDDLDRAFAAMSSERPDAVLAFIDVLLIANVQRLAELSLARRLPVFSGSRPLVEAGTLAAYGPDLAVIAQRSAAYVRRVLNGAKPGEIAVELPTKFELILNSRTANALGLTIPSSVLVRADQVIQ